MHFDKNIFPFFESSAYYILNKIINKYIRSGTVNGAKSQVEAGSASPGVASLRVPQRATGY